MAARAYPELLAKLRSQVGFLERSSASFDEGNEDEGERLALASRVLLHDTGSSHSLLGQLGVKTALRYSDTSIRGRKPEKRYVGNGIYAATATVHAGLVQLRTTETGAWSYAPVLTPESGDRINPPAQFEQWWGTPFLTDAASKPVTRKSVVLAVANKDGGAHVARAIPEAFRRLSSGASMPFQTGTGDEWSDIPGVVMATMRQIAFELLDTLHRDLPNFISKAPLEGAELTAVEKSALPRNAPCLCGSGKKFKHCHGA